MPVIMTGVRTMLVILVSAATLGAVVGAGGLGVPIMSGIGSFNNAVVVYGAVPAILLALILDRALVGGSASAAFAVGRARTALHGVSRSVRRAW